MVDDLGRQKVKLLSAPKDGVVYDPSRFRYNFYFMGVLVGWINLEVTQLLEKEGIDWRKWMWKRTFGN